MFTENLSCENVDEKLRKIRENRIRQIEVSSTLLIQNINKLWRFFLLIAKLEQSHLKFRAKNQHLYPSFLMSFLAWKFNANFRWQHWNCPWKTVLTLWLRKQLDWRSFALKVSNKKEATSVLPSDDDVTTFFRDKKMETIISGPFTLK